MDFLLLAAGEGSRLKKAAIQHAKPMVPLCGAPMVERLVQAFLASGASRLLVVYNEESPDFEAWLNAQDLPIPLVTVRKSTPSSLHSFAALLPHVQSEKFCMTTVDTVFQPAPFADYIAAFNASTNGDGLMAVTGFVDDESPLWVRTDAQNRILSFDDERGEGTTYVSGGIYCLRQTVFPTVTKAIESGTHRMRNFQRLLLAAGHVLYAHPFEKIMDVDRPEDLHAAERWLQDGEGANAW